MKFFRYILIGLLTVWNCATALSQPQGTVVHYDEMDGLPHGHVTQLLQDSLGFLWFATWNGLCRYDGYEFQTFKPQMGDGCHMTTDRYRDIALRPDGQMVCRVDEDCYLFDTRTYRFRDLTAEEAQSATDDLKQYRQSRIEGRFTLTDRQGNDWKISGNGIDKIMPRNPVSERIDISPEAEVKCLVTDGQQRCWICTKDDEAIRLYRAGDMKMLGYLGRDGRLHNTYTRFGAAVYCMYQSADGTIWLGSKPGGLFRLTETAAGHFRIGHFLNELTNPSVYNLLPDRYGRLWIATFGGLCYLEGAFASGTDGTQKATPRFRTPLHYPKDIAQKVRYLQITPDGLLLAATTEGLMVSELQADADRMQFRLHQREANRAESLSCSAIMDIAQDARGNYYVSTESGGFDRIDNTNLLDSQFCFTHHRAENHRLPNDVVLSITALPDGGLMVVGSHLITLLDSIGTQHVLDAGYFQTGYRFSDAHPQRVKGNSWLLGLQDGAFCIADTQMHRQAYSPQLVLTGISVQGGTENPAVAYTDTLILAPTERSVTVRFAAIDHTSADRIGYAFRMQPDAPWTLIGQNRSVVLLDLAPDTYRLQIRSTDADGQWQDNTRTLTIVVQPTFWESVWGRLLIVLLCLSTLSGIAYTYLYIRRMQRKHRETLEAYLALLETQKEDAPETDIQPAPAPQLEYDPMLKRVMAFIEENISNEDVSVGDMADAAATSRSGLQRKLKQAMGVTPQELLHEARIKHACNLLRETALNVSEVAYQCGFSDPKYFSRCFKQRTGKTPSEYKSND
jgi:AraC-like DNA-binding protein